MPLTPDQSALVRGTVSFLRTHGETIASRFYASLLRAHPDLNNLFNSANQANGRQPRALVSVILAYAASPAHTYELIPRLERVCNKHCSLGITPDQYDLVGKYLLEAFGEVLGEKWTPSLRGAWENAYKVLANMLIGREAQLYSKFGSWKGFRFFRIEQKICEADDFYSFHLSPSDRKPLPSFSPGQYVSLRIDVPSIGYLQSRQYALSECPRKDYYRISVKRDRGIQANQGIEAFHLKPGLVSNLLIDKYEVGDLVSLSHPAGGFQFDVDVCGTGPIVFISAGAGATTLLSILNNVVEREDDRPLSWIHCSSRKAPFEEHVRCLARARDNFTIRLFQSQLADLEYRCGSAHGEGLKMDFQKLERKTLHLDHGATEYYICGPEAFTKDMSASLLGQGVDRARVKYEWFTTGELQLAA
ncbi:Flavohemoprotein-like protein [Hapsidospora chrysogenum ATCC 11550]|uniref:nitric oxide dioxygenase n=1 Tax=Hapsidospora chrysogenum (strain ATCC 11550 / CBS 779.69 / DSM 880 / IAM 14645 / JCM 23072 / IMI 49137) TaxID=857340 RepID=A0A086T6U0_HAPC1|nr:Flavohemoprotein-like protein [Hapsidospora chrysogenum ATCC 11550]